jgi:hypothetical protein
MMQYLSKFTFEQELSLGYHFLNMGEIDKARNHYFSIISLAKMDIVAKGDLQGFLIDIVATILKIDINYFISTTDQGHYVEYDIDNTLLRSFLDKDKYPWVDKVGLSLIVRKLLEFDHDKPHWDKKLFVKPYGSNSLLKFGENDGQYLSSVLINNPKHILRYVNELFHFYLSFNTLINSHLVDFILTNYNSEMYWRIAARCILKDIIKSSLDHVNDTISDHQYELKEERRQAQTDAEEWFNIAYEGDASNLWNTD